MRHSLPLSTRPSLPCDAAVGSRRRRWTARLPACLAALLLIVGGQAQSSGGPTGAAAGEAALQADIRAEIGDARCEVDADCRTLPVGHKACGGPQQWLAWSGGADRAGRLEDLSRRLSALQQSRDERSGAVSNCQYNADPGAACRAGRCLLRGQPGRAAAN